MTEAETKAAPDPVRDLLPIYQDGGLGDRLYKAMHAYLDEYVFSPDEGSDHEPTEFERMLLEDFFNGAISDEAVNAILQEAARAMQEARLAQGGEPAMVARDVCDEFCDGKNLHPSERNRLHALSRRIARAMQKAMREMEPLGAEFERIWDANIDRLYEFDEAPAPAAASDDLVEKAQAQNALALEKYGMSIPVLSEMCARIEADAAEKAAKDAEIERLKSEIADYNDERTRDLAAAIERAEAAEARVKGLEEKLTDIANAYTAHVYSDAMDAVQALKDIARSALK